MNRSYTLADIEQKTGLSVNRLRYVIDTNFLPGWRSLERSPTRGAARIFMGFEAFAIAISVFMLDSGIKRKTAERCLDLMTEYPKGTRDMTGTMLYQAYSRKEIVGLEIGDRQNIRLVGAVPSTSTMLPWIQVETRAELAKYDPQVTIRINMTRLRESLPST